MRSILVFLALVAAASAFGGQFMPGPWYEELNKSSLTPPGWVFGPVWLVLYVMIAISGWLVWRNVLNPKHPAVICWGGQLILNAMWTWIFFGLQNPGLAQADILFLLAFILAFILYSYPVSRAASALFIPYGLWVGLASYLNLMIILLN